MQRVLSLASLAAASVDFHDEFMLPEDDADAVPDTDNDTDTHPCAAVSDGNYGIMREAYGAHASQYSEYCGFYTYYSKRREYIAKLKEYSRRTHPDKFQTFEDNCKVAKGYGFSTLFSSSEMWYGTMKECT